MTYLTASSMQSKQAHMCGAARTSALQETLAVLSIQRMWMACNVCLGMCLFHYLFTRAKLLL
jgi:hypothetical protein